MSKLDHLKAILMDDAQREFPNLFREADMVRKRYFEYGLTWALKKCYERPGDPEWTMAKLDRSLGAFDAEFEQINDTKALKS